MNNPSIEKIIYEETEKRLEIMSKEDYEFPKKIAKTDWILICGIVIISIFLVILCMIGVIE
ncbi:hypothetical protein HMPREF9126_0771 [Parvimonas sp. oral taxon 110 str. F0139]|nr:hypothetical protein HMPREF9126_0771 [Parvimonas sp. oral taxon 110 str. F0139]